MPLQFKAPPADLSDAPADAAGHNRSSLPHSAADQPQEAYQSPLVDALLEQLRQARARRQTPH